MDTGPGVMVIDGLVRHYTGGAELFDRDGERAARGTVNRTLLDELMQESYIQMPPPKAAGREQYGTHWVREIAARAVDLGMSEDDVIATATMLTVESVAINLERWAIPTSAGPSGTLDELIVGGGGALNPTMLRMFAERLGCKVSTHDDYGNSSFAMEVMIGALSAWETYIGHVTHNPWHSGAESATFDGIVAPGYHGLPPALAGNGWRAVGAESPAPA